MPSLIRKGESHTSHFESTTRGRSQTWTNQMGHKIGVSLEIAEHIPGLEHVVGHQILNSSP